MLPAPLAVHVPPQNPEEMWNLEALEEALRKDFGTVLPIRKWAEEDTQLDDRKIKAKIAELWAAGVPAWKIREEAGVSRHAVLRQVRRLRTPNKPEPVRSELRLSLAEREEISFRQGAEHWSTGRRLRRASGPTGDRGRYSA